tara:strand:- start:778 stop:1245 length:468 start_codon:yes stop_codon:yes gene_type:complete
MATTNARLQLTNDVTSSIATIDATFSLLKAGSAEGMDNMTSVRKILKSTNQVDLITALSVPGNIGTADNAASSSHNFVYINNASTDSTEFITVTQGHAAGSGTEVIVEQIGRLYGGDWMFIPWSAQVTADAADVGDICIKPNVATEMPIEFILFS